MDIKEKTPQEITIESLKEKLGKLTTIEQYFSSRKYLNDPEKDRCERWAGIIQDIINEKTAELQQIENHFVPPPAEDAREKYIAQVENENIALRKELQNMQIQLELYKKQEQKNNCIDCAINKIRPPCFCKSSQYVEVCTTCGGLWLPENS